MRVAVTGASGLLGRALIERLRRIGGYRITALSRRPRLSDGDLTWLEGDLSDPDVCRRLVKGQQAVVHLAHNRPPLASGLHFAEDAREDLLPTLTLLDAIAAEAERPRFVFSSSGGAIYGTAHGERPFREADPCLPVNSYGIVKLTIEHYLRLAAGRRHLSAIVLRIANAYGEALSPDASQGLIGTAVARLRAGLPVRVIGNAENVRDYVHLDDVVTAMVEALSCDGDFEIFNIGAGTGHSVTQVIDAIERAWGEVVTREEQSHPNAQALNNYCVLDIEKARDGLGWTPTIDLEEGLRRLVGDRR